ncbi:MAG: NADH-quinone oxidoreductase subunit C [Candidatus Accumulibacter sp.]|nr:NADH-quinone oxidoreductase subunit C [Accumulibacter sp.]
MPKLAESLVQTLRDAFGERVSARVCLGEASIDVAVGDYLEVMERLRDAPDFRFEQLIDVCGIDYSAYGKTPWPGRRFAVVSHLLSISKNRRVRVRCFAPDDVFPSIPSVSSIWNSADWFEREAFDLFGIVFTGHANLRRILTDYGFDGHPLRKDFPVSGKVEVRYDAELARVVGDPVSIQPRVTTPRVFPE